MTSGSENQLTWKYQLLLALTTTIWMCIKPYASLYSSIQGLQGWLCEDLNILRIPARTTGTDVHTWESPRG